MSVPAFKWAFAQEGLTTGEKLVLVALGDHANEHNECWPNQDTLAKKCSMHRVSVARCLKSLEGKGLLTHENRKRKGRQRSNLYRLKVGLMLVSTVPPCNPTLHDHVTYSYTDVYPYATHEPTIETTIEPTKGASAMKTSDILEQLSQSDSDETIMGKVKWAEPGQQYKVGHLAQMWRNCYSKYHGGFQKDFTGKQIGLVKDLSKKLQERSVKVIFFAVKDWSKIKKFLEKECGGFGLSKKPTIEQVHKHQQDIANFLAKSEAKKELTLQPVKPVAKKEEEDLTKPTAKTQDEGIATLDELMGYFDDE